MAQNPDGKIVTFYSYKGGVGRTMALANVAFLAARNGKRVLMMDWDLEAPGLHYYFRGFMDTVEAKSFKDSPGVLNILWKWRNAVNKAKTGAAVKKAADTFSSGKVFWDCVRNINLSDDGAGRLDYISAGASVIHAPTLCSYEEALADFSWNDFFTNLAGGAMLSGLRDWAKQNYDYILIDSRTGLADVSGVCTIQLPDVVALCFIMNRQNIEGVAKVASAIRLKRDGEVQVRAVPMRVSHSGTGVEADANARALHELNKVGRFPLELLAEDLRVLPVRAEPSVPYYETLAPIVATELETDPLTKNYQRLGQHILGIPLDLPELDQTWIDAVKRRFHPKHATSDYLATLKTSDPIRAATELEGLLDSALQAALDGLDLDDEYVEALVNTVIDIRPLAEDAFGATTTLDLAIELCRTLVADNTPKWSGLLVAALRAYLDDISYMMDHEEQLALHEEIDSLLTQATTSEDAICRIENRRQIARLYLTMEDYEAARLNVSDLRRLVSEVGSGLNLLNEEQVDRYWLVSFDVEQLDGEICERLRQYEEAIEWYNSALQKAEASAPRPEITRFIAELQGKLARTYNACGKLELAAAACVEAARRGPTSSSILYSFVDFARIVLMAGNLGQLVNFCKFALELGERRVGNQYASYYGRLPWTATSFIEISHSITQVLIALEVEDSRMIIRTLGEISAVIVSNTLRRRSGANDERIVALMAVGTHYGDLLLSHKLYEGLGANLSQVIESARHLVRRTAG